MRTLVWGHIGTRRGATRGVNRFHHLKLIKVRGSHYNRLGNIGRDLEHLGRQDAHLKSDSTGSLRVVTSEHGNADAGLMALADRRRRLGARTIIQADKTVERQGQSRKDLGPVQLRYRQRGEYQFG